MKQWACDVAVIGSGPAGLAAAYQAREAGAGRVLLIERNPELGGILPQCIHNGFGVRLLGSDYTGPEYAAEWVRRAARAGVEALTDTMVLSLAADRTLLAVNAAHGLIEIRPRALVLAMGCRERPRGALAIPGTRPAGVYTAGTAQRLVNIEGYMPGERFVILGSGDIGMIMARRVTLEGAQVVAMLEILPTISGLRRNLVQCIRDFDIPLRLCTTVVEVCGRERVQAVRISQIDAHWRPIPGTEELLPCDTLLLSVGLIPENELSRMAGVRLDPITGGPVVDECLATNLPGVFAAGNVVHVYDLVDDVTESALRAGRAAASYAHQGPRDRGRTIPVRSGEGVRHVVPQQLHTAGWEEAVTLSFRVRMPLEEAVRAEVRMGSEVLLAQRLRYVRPSEMVTLTLEPALAPRLADAEALEVRVVRR